MVTFRTSELATEARVRDEEMLHIVIFLLVPDGCDTDRGNNVFCRICNPP